MIYREIESTLKTMAAQFKSVAITGPRQSGKTTLAQMTFPNKAYVSLETPDERMRATEDPRLFLSRFPDGCIIDEVQRVPELFSYLQEELDASTQPGKYILTGSQQFGLMEKISQSLAGRVGLLTLLPFSYSELEDGKYTSFDIDQVMFRSAYPPIFDQNIDSVPWLDAYVGTYVERDIRQIVNIQNIAMFQRFLALCAGNIGQLFNATRIGNDCGLNHGTVANWLSILETSYIAFRLPPHFQNFRKRLVKTPKLYFYDTGLAIRLLGIESPSQLKTHPMRGMLFENWVISEFLKGRFNRGLRSNLFFWRNNTGLEVDVIVDQASKLQPIEIKSGSTLSNDWLGPIKKWCEISDDASHNPTLIYGGETDWNKDDITLSPWRNVPILAKKL